MTCTPIFVFLGYIELVIEPWDLLKKTEYRTMIRFFHIQGNSPQSSNMLMVCKPLFFRLCLSTHTVVLESRDILNKVVIRFLHKQIILFAFKGCIELVLQLWEILNKTEYKAMIRFLHLQGKYTQLIDEISAEYTKEYQSCDAIKWWKANSNVVTQVYKITQRNVIHQHTEPTVQ